MATLDYGQKAAVKSLARLMSSMLAEYGDRLDSVFVEVSGSSHPDDYDQARTLFENVLQAMENLDDS